MDVAHPTPVISVVPRPGGLRVTDTRTPSVGWATSIVYVSTDQGFEPSADTVVDTGRRARFDIPWLDPGTRYYVRLVRIGTKGERSEPSDEMSAVAGTIVDHASWFAAGIKPVVVV